MIYELWKDKTDSSYSFFPETNTKARSFAEKDSVLVWTVEADSWEEACKIQYKYLAWGAYKP